MNLEKVVKMKVVCTEKEEIKKKDGKNGKMCSYGAGFYTNGGINFEGEPKKKKKKKNKWV